MRCVSARFAQPKYEPIVEKQRDAWRALARRCRSGIEDLAPKRKDPHMVQAFRKAVTAVSAELSAAGSSLILSDGPGGITSIQRVAEALTSVYRLFVMDVPRLASFPGVLVKNPKQQSLFGESLRVLKLNRML
jgi:hypothetical protein